MNIDAIVAESRAKGVLNWILENPSVVNINSVETLSVALDVLLNPTEEGKKAVQGIWEYRKENAENFCQATPDSAYVGLMEAIVYGNETPAGLKENRAYVERVFGVNVYARINKAEQLAGFPPRLDYSNPTELSEIAKMRLESGVELDPSISQYTDALLAELAYTLQNKMFQNIVVSNTIENKPAL